MNYNQPEKNMGLGGYNRGINEATSAVTGCSYQEQCESPRRELDAIGDDLAQTLQIIHDLNKRASVLGDRLLGAHPQANGKNEASPTPVSMVSKLATVANYLRTSALQLSDDLGRLERL